MPVATPAAVRTAGCKTMYTDADLRDADPKGGPSESGGRLLTIRRETAGLDKWQRPLHTEQNPAYTPCFFIFPPQRDAHDVPLFLFPKTKQPEKDSGIKRRQCDDFRHEQRFGLDSFPKNEQAQSVQHQERP